MRAQPGTQLEREGYLVLPGFISRQLLERLRETLEELWTQEGGHAGSEFRQEPGARRLANLVAKGEVFREVIANPDVLGWVAQVLGPRFKLSSLNARSANPNSDCRLPLHADMGALADERGYWVCNTVWMLDDFTAENGALRAVPGSHRWGTLPQQALADPMAAHPQEILVTGAAGTVAIMNAHLWHGGTANRTARPRRALHAFYCRWDKPQQQYQKNLLPAETQTQLTPALRQLLALDDPLNDELSSAMTRPSGFLK